MSMVAASISNTRAWVPYCGPGADPASLLTDWNLDPPLLLALAAAAVWIGMKFVRTRHGGAAAGAWLVLFALFVTPLCAMSAALFSVRVANHIALVAAAAPPLSAAMGQVRPIERGAGFATIAIGAHVAVFWLWHGPAPYAFALSYDAGYWLMQLSLLVTAIGFWRCVGARCDRPVALASILTGFVAQMGFLGALIAFAPEPLYIPHFATTAPWELSPLADQQLAGLLMWVPGMVPYLAVLVVVVRRWFVRLNAESPA
ncbi:hypothetical protein GCM10011367_11020 [Marinicauda pacifica]|nr:hypothetical protein GCM10011367_11020 [Marinicauda pacifica]